MNRSSGFSDPQAELDILDRRPSERGIEPTNRLEHISPNRTEAGPESRNRIASVLMNLMMSKVRIGGRDARSLRPIVVRADRRRDRGAGVRLSEWFEKASIASGWTSTSASTKTSQVPRADAAARFLATPGPTGFSPVRIARIHGRESPARSTAPSLEASSTTITSEESPVADRIASTQRERSDPAVVDWHDYRDIDRQIRRLSRQRSAPRSEA